MKQEEGGEYKREENDRKQGEDSILREKKREIHCKECGRKTL